MNECFSVAETWLMLNDVCPGDNGQQQVELLLFRRHYKPQYLEAGCFVEGLSVMFFQSALQ